MFTHGGRSSSGSGSGGKVDVLLLQWENERLSVSVDALRSECDNAVAQRAAMQYKLEAAMARHDFLVAGLSCN